MSRLQDQNRPDNLVTEFEALAWSLAHRFSALLKTGQTLGFLTLEDLKQEALIHLLEHAGKFKGVTDRDERGLIAWNLCRSGIWRMYLRDSFESYSRDANKSRAKKGLPQVIVPEVVPVLTGTEVGGDSDSDFTTADLGEVEPDFSSEVEWLVSLEQTMPSREFAMLIDHTYNGRTWAELGDQYGFEGKNEASRAAQANDAVDAALGAAGFRPDRHEMRRMAKLKTSV